MNDVILSASMMCVSPWENGSATLQELLHSKVERLHIDVMDGHFVPNLMLGTESIHHLRQASTIPLDIHLMIGMQIVIIKHYLILIMIILKHIFFCNDHLNIQKSLEIYWKKVFREKILSQ